MSRCFSGLWPAMVTPMNQKGKPCVQVLEQLVDLFVEQNLDGLYLLGSTGQGPLLSVEDRCLVAQRVVEFAAGRIPIMVHVGSITTEDSVTLAKHAETIGADAVSSVAPYYYGHTDVAVFEHYRLIGEATRLPMFVYHLASINRLHLSAKDYVARLMELPHISGMKFTDHNLYQLGLLNHHSAGKLQIFSGADELLCQAVVSGAVGAIGTFYNLFGPCCRDARESVLQGNIQNAQLFMMQFQSVVEQVLARGDVWGFLRRAMYLRYDIDIGMPRAPLGVSLNEWKDEEIRVLTDRVFDAIATD